MWFIFLLYIFILSLLCCLSTIFFSPFLEVFPFRFHLDYLVNTSRRKFKTRWTTRWAKIFSPVKEPAWSRRRREERKVGGVASGAGQIFSALEKVKSESKFRISSSKWRQQAFIYIVLWGGERPSAYCFLVRVLSSTRTDVVLQPAK